MTNRDEIDAVLAKLTDQHGGCGFFWPPDLYKAIQEWIAAREACMLARQAEQLAVGYARDLRSLAQMFCPHPRLVPKESHNNPGPSDSWDECTTCEMRFSFKAAVSW